MEKVKKYLNYLFINTTPKESTPAWVRVTKSTELAHTMNAKTEDFDYIADKNSTEELDSYKPTIQQTQTAYIGDKVYDYIFELYRLQKTGSDAVGECMIVFQQKAGTGEDTGNKAMQFNALITIDTADFVAGTITYTISQRGTPVHGTAKVVADKPTFTAAA